MVLSECFRPCGADKCGQSSLVRYQDFISVISMFCALWIIFALIHLVNCQGHPPGLRCLLSFGKGHSEVGCEGLLCTWYKIKVTEKETLWHKVGLPFSLNSLFPAAVL